MRNQHQEAEYRERLPAARKHAGNDLETGRELRDHSHVLNRNEL